MPPRYAYWTILIDDKPTAFRAADRADLLPTLHQLQRKNSNVVMKWFARGRVWDSPEQAQRAGKIAPREKRSRDWRPGGEHRDPRARFDERGREGRAAGPAPRRERPWSSKPQTGRPQGDRTWSGKPRAGGHRPRGKKPFPHDRPRHDPRGRDVLPRAPRENEPPKRRDETPDTPPAPEQIVIRPKPPERG